MKPENPYDAEQAINAVMASLPEHCPDVVDRLKTGAFNAGTAMSTVLFVGAIYLRNLIFKDLGFSIDQN